MKRQIAGYNVYRAAEGVAPDFHGFAKSVNEAYKLAEKPGLEASLWDTAEKARHCGGLHAPEQAHEAEEPYEWFGEDGSFCLIPVYLPLYRISDGAASEVIEAQDMEDAKEQAQEIWADGSWDTKGTIQVQVQEIDGEGGELGHPEWISVEVGSDPEPPECVEEEEEHDWQAPYEVVGGLKENPGICSTGGTGLKIIEVCANCGCYKITHWHGSQRNPGQHEENIEYREADEASTMWLEQDN